MKKTIFFLLFGLLAAFFTGCQESPETVDPQSIIGTWEFRTYRDDLGLDFVDTFVFFGNGQFNRANTFREVEAQEDLGYRYYLEGSYQITGNEIQFIHENEFALQGIGYTALENLPELEENDGRSAKISLNQNKTLLTLEFPCLEILSSPCAPPREYRWVD